MSKEQLTPKIYFARPLKLRLSARELRRLLKIEHFLYLVGLALFATFLAWFIFLNYLDWDSQSGQSGGAVTADQQLYKSLSIADLRRAVFTSSAVKRQQDLGIHGSSHQFVFSFSVPHDNLTEYGLMSLPLSPPPAGGYPVLILCHGYAEPWSYSTTKSYLNDVQFYSSHGFAVLKPDYRGQGLSINDGQPDGAYYSSAYNTDVLSLTAAAKRTPYLNKNNISIWGHSLGAYIALRAAVVSSDYKDIILLSGPVGTIQDMFTAYTPISDISDPAAANTRLAELTAHGTPLSNPVFWDKVSPLNYLKDTKGYIQIHVGTADHTVPPLMSADLDRALTKLGKPHQYFVYPGGNHGLGPQRSAIWSRSLSLLKSS
ncbi:MAG TPA: alpha/beta fold hydrolase [Candidatus Saccharimonadales bacterium]|nr:alpha/beta fold hydrolase [Candidatus Saccharimonadales bacterium]